MLMRALLLTVLAACAVASPPRAGPEDDSVLISATAPAVADSSLVSPIASEANGTQTAPNQMELRKSIKAKAQKLRQLKLEARQVAMQLRRERRLRAGAAESKAAKLQKWKERMRRRVKSILKRVTRLEKAMKTRRNEFRVAVTAVPKTARNKQHLQKVKKQHKKKVVTLPTTAQPVLTSAKAPVLTTTAATATSMDQTPAAVALASAVAQKSASKKRSVSVHRGVDGSPCGTHKDCAPGHCCHRFGALTAINSICIRHDVLEGGHCEHSCACVGPLKCVRSTHPGHTKQQPHCRRLSPSELARLSSSGKKEISLPHFPIHF